ncbi:GlxA family transcriptional regulator [Aquimarina sediminis]|uniref:GlxA family transcriptional regulator n=1 Tax=Aquimarina sediminis TaxID=2070536 RepID=UPI000CA08C6E|nr:DJ-1/PfpI family protein [Aquimarina sediminis]
MKNIYFLIPPETHPLDIIGPAQLFYECIENGAALQLFFISSSSNNEISSSLGLHFSKLISYTEVTLGKNDVLVVPGIKFSLLIDVTYKKESIDFYNWLHSQYKNGATMVSVCTGAFLLAEAGLLKGKKATTHWKAFETFEQKFPDTEVLKNRLFVENERIYTSAGMLSGIDLCLYLVEKEYGIKFAIEIAKEVVMYFRRSESDPQLSIFLQFRNHLDTRIHNAQDFVANNLASSFTIEDIADNVNMSVRNLTRQFKKTTGITIGDYLAKLRVEQSVHLLAEGYTLEYTTKECGLKSTNQLRALLKKYEEVIPTDLNSVK